MYFLVGWQYQWVVCFQVVVFVFFGEFVVYGVLCGVVGEQVVGQDWVIDLFCWCGQIGYVGNVDVVVVFVGEVFVFLFLVVVGDFYGEFCF